jgi:hypothetical protein
MTAKKEYKFPFKSQVILVGHNGDLVHVHKVKSKMPTPFSIFACVKRVYAGGEGVCRISYTPL